MKRRSTPLWLQAIAMFGLGAAANLSLAASERCHAIAPIAANVEMSGLNRGEPAFADARDALRAGRYEAAKKHLAQAPGSRREPAERSIALSLLTLAHAGANEHSATRAAAQQALAVPGVPSSVAADSALNVAVALSSIGDDRQALEALRQASRAADEANDTVAKARVAANITVISTRMPDLDARASARETLEAVRHVPDPALRAALLVTAGDALASANVADKAVHALLREAYASASAAGNAGEAARALGLMAMLQRRAGAQSESARTLARALALSRAAAGDVWAFRWQWLLGHAQREAGERAAARDSFERAAELLDEARTRHSLGALRASLAWREVYTDFADALLRESAGAANPARKTALAKAREALELSRAAEIEDFFNDPCIAARAGRRAAPEDVDARVAVIHPVVLADRLEIIVGHRSGLEQFTVKRSGREIAGAVLQLRNFLEKRTTRQYLRPAQQLHDALIAPIEAHLARLGVDTLVIVPDGALRTVPFAALHDRKTFLMERYSIAVTPVASLTDPQRLSGGQIRALLSGLTEARQGFSALPAVEEELKSAAAVLHAPIFVDRDFSSSSLESALSKAPINLLHVASHGQFSRDPAETFLLTFDGRLTLAQLRQAIAAGKVREEPLELLTLSACQTATGDDRAALGLAGVALGAGARSALASLWAVNDESTSLLISAFYRNLAGQGLTKAAALRQAQLELARDERYAHPAYWAPFLIIGNWL